MKISKKQRQFIESLTKLKPTAYGREDDDDVSSGVTIYGNDAIMFHGFNRAIFPHLLVARVPGRVKPMTFRVDGFMMLESDHTKIRRANPNGWGCDKTITEPGVTMIGGVEVELFAGPIHADWPDFPWQNVVSRIWTVSEEMAWRQIQRSHRVAQ